MNTTKVATLDTFRPHKYNKWLGVGVGLGLSLMLLIAGSAAYFSGVFVEASNDAPQELLVSKITDNSARLDWTTAIENQGYVEYGTSPTALSLIAPEASPNRSHGLDLSLLRAATTYYFHIRVGDKVFDDAGNPWTCVTKTAPATAEAPPAPDPIEEVLTPEPTEASSCPSTDCDVIKSFFGKGCDTADYIRANCVGQ